MNTNVTKEAMLTNLDRLLKIQDLIGSGQHKKKRKKAIKKVKEYRERLKSGDIALYEVDD